MAHHNSTLSGHDVRLLEEAFRDPDCVDLRPVLAYASFVCA